MVVFTTGGGGGGSSANVGLTTGLLLPYLESFCGPAYFFTREDDLFRVRMIYYASGY